MSSGSHHAFQRCIQPTCQATFGVEEVLTACPRCGSLLDVAYEWNKIKVPSHLVAFEDRYAQRRDPLNFSGVWRFRELLPFPDSGKVLTIGEGQTLFRREPLVARYVGMEGGPVFLQYEGLNPSGSFKDNGMTAAFSHARMVGARRMACASTGNTSSSLACYAAATRGLGPEERMDALVFVGSGRIALGKLSQGLDYGARTLQIQGRFDDAMQRVQEASRSLGIYLVNSVNPFRLEGQKTIMYRVLEGLGWEVPDWIVVPGGNLGNSSAFGKAFRELKELGLISRMPRLAVVNAEGAQTLYQLYTARGMRWHGGTPDEEIARGYYRELEAQGIQANTLASAIEINRPVNLHKCLRALEWMDGLVLQASDEEILDAKAAIGQAGLGCEPASAASVAGLKKLVESGTVGRTERVVCVITGHQLKAPDITVGYHSLKGPEFAKHFEKYGPRLNRLANPPVQLDNDLQAILAACEGRGP